MGCQTSIAEKIIDSRADYILAVKANQSNLQQAIKDTILLENPQSTHIWDDFGHGRIQKRTCRAFQELSHIENPEKWKGLSTLFVIDTEILDKSSGKISQEQRLYISSLQPNAKELNRKIRKHWSIENNLHWVLDVEFGEDDSRIRKGYASENFNIILKIDMGLLSNDKNSKHSKKAKRLKAAIDKNYREKLLGFF